MRIFKFLVIILLFSTAFAQRNLVYVGANWEYILDASATLKMNTTDKTLSTSNVNYTLGFNGDLNYIFNVGVISDSVRGLKAELSMMWGTYYAKTITDDNTGESHNVLASDKINAYYTLTTTMMNFYYDFLQFNHSNGYTGVYGTFGIGTAFFGAPKQVAAPRLNLAYQVGIGVHRMLGDRIDWNIIGVRYFDTQPQTTDRKSLNTKEVLSFNNAVKIETGVNFVF